MVNSKVNTRVITDVRSLQRTPRRKELVFSECPVSNIRIEYFSADHANVLLYVDSDSYLVFDSIDDAFAFLRNNFRF